VARRLTDLYLAQVLRHGYFHADPHPGNIFVRPARGGFQIAFVDFGMMGAVTPANKRALTTAFVAAIRQDATLLVDALGALGFLGAPTQREGLENALTQLLARYSTLSMGELREMDPAELMEDVETLLYGNQFRLPSQFAFLGRAVATLSGLVTLLAPEFNFLEVALPYAREYLGHGALASLLGVAGVDTLGDLGQLVAREGVAVARSVAALPRLVERVLERVEHGELHLVLDSAELSTRAHARVGGRLATRALSRPVPIWVPLGLGGVAVAALAMWRRAANGG
jgi:predicted unusual protein kinase regulating ubiquinone biosynthesis (AarF/ABC1/UbiB family)